MTASVADSFLQEQNMAADFNRIQCLFRYPFRLHSLGSLIRCCVTQPTVFPSSSRVSCFALLCLCLSLSPHADSWFAVLGTGWGAQGSLLQWLSAILCITRRFTPCRQSKWGAPGCVHTWRPDLHHHYGGYQLTAGITIIWSEWPIANNGPDALAIGPAK